MANGMVNSMEVLVEMDEAGRLVLPKAVRRALGISRRTKFRAEVVGAKVELIPCLESTARLEKDAHGLLVVKATGKPFNAVEALAEIRRERG